VKRQIWQIDLKLFREKVFPLLEEYIKDPDVVSNSNEMMDENRISPKKRFFFF